MKIGKLTSFGSEVNELEQASQARFDDAEALLQSGRYAAAIMMGIYSLETLMKVDICRRLDLDALPKLFEVHDFDDLLILTGRSKRCRQDNSLSRKWDVLKDWSGRLNELRYNDLPKVDHFIATDVLEKVKEVREWFVKPI